MQHINTNKDNNILHSTFFIFLLLAFLIEPDGIVYGSYFGMGYFTPFHNIYIYIKYFSFAVAVFLILNIRKPSMMFVLIVIYEIIILLSSIMNGNLTRSGFIIAVKILSLGVMAEYYMYHTPIKYLKSLTYLLTLLVILNFITLILYPDGMYMDDRRWTQNFFLGYKNLHVYIFLPCLLCVSIYEYLKTKRFIYTLLLICIMIISCLISGSTTSMIVISLYFVAVLFLTKIKIPQFLDANLVYFVAFVISIVMISMTISGTFDQYTAQLTDAFEKESDTMDARGIIWIQSLLYLEKNPVIGNGDLTFDVGWAWDVSQVHNNYLDMAVIGGISLLCVFFAQIYLLSRRMKKIEIKEVSNLILFYLIGFSIEFLTEGKRNNFLWFPSLIIIYYVPNIIQKLKIQNTLNKIKFNKTFK